MAILEKHIWTWNLFDFLTYQSFSIDKINVEENDKIIITIKIWWTTKEIDFEELLNNIISWNLELNSDTLFIIDKYNKKILYNLNFLDIWILPELSWINDFIIKNFSFLNSLSEENKNKIIEKLNIILEIFNKNEVIKLFNLFESWNITLDNLMYFFYYLWKIWNMFDSIWISNEQIDKYSNEMNKLISELKY